MECGDKDMELIKLCRLCAEERDCFVRIYEEEGQKLNLSTKIIQCLQIWLYPEDLLPKTVCIDCCAKLNQYFDFYETTTRAQVTLQVMFDPKMANRVVKKESELLSTRPAVNGPRNVCDTRDSFNGNEGEEFVGEVDEDNSGGGDADADEDEESGSDKPFQGAEAEDDGGETEPPEFVECVLSDKNKTVQQKSELSASSRRKCRTPIKREASSLKEKGLPKERSTGKTRASNRAPPKERGSSKDTVTSKERVQGKEKAKGNKADKRLKVKQEDQEQVIYQSELETAEVETAQPGVRNDERESVDQFSVATVKVEGEGHNVINGQEDSAGEKKAGKGGGRKRKDTKTVNDKPPRPKTVLDGYSWQCTDCPDVLSSLQELRQHHQNVHQQPPNFKCVQCSKAYTRYRSFARHVKLHRNPKKFKCEECGKCFSQKTVLQSHSTVHTDERPHVCPQCGKAFKQFSSLYLHSKCHLPDQVKPKFPCDICHKDFATKHTLETHRKIHTGERNFICDICGKSFIAKGSLDYHILTHSGEKPHHCSVCGKGFKTARLLGKHATLHTGIKPHQCDVCGKQFRERGALREHNRIHTGAMPYSCEFCGKFFRFKGILTVHRRQHTGERPYSCAECRREFTNWANYNKHMKRRHRNESDPLAINTSTSNRTTRTYQPPSGVMPIPATLNNTVRMMNVQPSAGSVPAAAGVALATSASPLGQTYSLSQHSSIDSSSGNSMIPMNHTCAPLAVSTGMYGAQNQMVKVANVYSSHTGVPGSASNVGTNGGSAGSGGSGTVDPSISKLPVTAVSNMFHGGTTLVGTSSSHKMGALSNMFHPGHQQESQGSVDRSGQHNNPLMGSYHVPSYVPAGLPMGSMGYYIPPIHHSDPNIDMLHGRMNSNQ